MSKTNNQEAECRYRLTGSKIASALTIKVRASSDDDNLRQIAAYWLQPEMPSALVVRCRQKVPYAETWPMSATLLRAEAKVQTAAWDQQAVHTP